MFINPLSLPALNLTQVVKAHRTDKERIVLEMQNGETECVLATDFEIAMRNTVQHMVPAASGTYAVYLSDDEDNAVVKEEVVAWALAANGILYPVTSRGVGGVNGDADDVLYPDGRVEAFDGDWPNLDAWRAYKVEERIGRLAARG